MFNRYQRYTALALMQRIYLSRTLWEIPPPLAMISCLFLVLKFDKPRSLDSILSALGYGEDFREKFHPEEKLDGIEIQVLSALDFKLKVYLPFRQIGPLAEGTGREEDCARCLFEILKTDALLLFPPHVIAAAAVASVLGIDHVMTAMGTLGLEISENLATDISTVLELPFLTLSEEELEICEKSISEELVIFEARREQEEREAHEGSKPTSLLPP